MHFKSNQIKTLKCSLQNGCGSLICPSPARGSLMITGQGTIDENSRLSEENHKELFHWLSFSCQSNLVILFFDPSSFQFLAIQEVLGIGSILWLGPLVRPLIAWLLPQARDTITCPRRSYRQDWLWVQSFVSGFALHSTTGCLVHLKKIASSGSVSITRVLH